MTDISQLKICFIAGTLAQGGAERQLFYIVRALKTKGAEVRVLSLTQGEFWEGPIQKLGVEVIGVGEAASRLRRTLRILQQVRRWQPQYVQSQHFYTNAYAAAAARILGGRDIGAMRNDGSSEVEDCGRISGKANLRLPRMLAGNSKPALAYATKQGIAGHRLFFLPNVVDTDLLTPRTPPPGNAIRILMVGRLEKQKRVDRFLNVIDRVRRNCVQPIKAIIVGSGSLKAQLMQQAKSLSLSPGHVEFRGKCADMPAVYQEAHLLALTSDHEGTPNVVLEAMASGLPVVATGVGGVPDLIRHGVNGFLAMPEQEECLAQAIIRLVESPKLRADLGAEARQFVLDHHSPETLFHYLENLYAHRNALA